MNNLPGIHIKEFNEKIKAMNQSNSKDMILTAKDARNLHADIFALLNAVSDLSLKLQEDSKDQSLNIRIDGGSF